MKTPDLQFVTEITTERGPCAWDMIRLANGCVMVVDEDVVAIYESQEQYDSGFSPLDMMPTTKEGDEI